MDLLVRVAVAEKQFERAVRQAGAASTMHPSLGKLLPDGRSRSRRGGGARHRARACRGRLG
jgi:hypothetical protein